VDAASEPGERARPDDAVRPFPSLADSKRRSRRGAPAPEPEAEPATERTAWPPVPPAPQVPAQPDPYVEVAPPVSTAPWEQQAAQPPQVHAPTSLVAPPETYQPQAAPYVPPAVEEPVTQRDPYLAPISPPVYPDPYLPQVSPAPAQFQPMPVPVSPPAPPPPAKRREGRSLWRYAPIPAALLLAVAIVWGAVALRGQPSGENAAPSTSDSVTGTGSSPPPTALGTGGYTITYLASGLCLGEGPEPGNTAKTVLVQADCATAGPPMFLNTLEPGVYQLQMDHPKYGIGCVTPDGADVDELYIGQECDATGAMEQQRFLLEAAEGGYRLQNVASGHCMAPLGGEAAAGVAFVQARCGGPGQSFAFTAR